MSMKELAIHYSTLYSAPAEGRYPSLMVIVGEKALVMGTGVVVAVPGPVERREDHRLEPALQSVLVKKIT